MRAQAHVQRQGQCGIKPQNSGATHHASHPTLHNTAQHSAAQAAHLPGDVDVDGLVPPLPLGAQPHDALQPPQQAPVEAVGGPGGVEALVHLGRTAPGAGNKEVSK